MLRQLLMLSFVGLSIGACAAGKAGPSGGGGGDDTSTTTSTTTGTGASGGGGTGGTGGTSSNAGGGGTGGSGGSTTTTADGGTGGTGGSTGGAGGGGAGGTGGTGGAPQPTETAIVLAGAAASALTADYHPGEAWSTGMLAQGTSHAPAAALLGASDGVGLIRASADGSLLFTKYASGSFSAPLAIGNLAKSMDAPSMVAWNGVAAVAYHKADFKHYFALYQGPMAGWSPVAEPILANNIHSFGPSAPRIAIVQGDVVIAYAGDNGNLYDQRRVNGAWESANGHGVDGTITLSPSIVGIDAGPHEAMIAYVRSSDTQVMYTVRTNGAWSAPAPVPDSFTNDPVALAATPAGGVALAFRGTNSMLYTCLYTPGNNPPWSLPASFGATVPVPPALAPGIGGAEAEMVLVSAGQAQHSRLIGGAWSAATPIGAGADVGAAIASFAP